MAAPGRTVPAVVASGQDGDRLARGDHADLDLLAASPGGGYAKRPGQGAALLWLGSCITRMGGSCAAMSSPASTFALTAGISAAADADMPVAVRRVRTGPRPHPWMPAPPAAQCRVLGSRRIFRTYCEPCGQCALALGALGSRETDHCALICGSATRYPSNGRQIRGHGHGVQLPLRASRQPITRLEASRAGRDQSGRWRLGPACPARADHTAGPHQRSALPHGRLVRMAG
jgi:hypothetical protein